MTNLEKSVKIADALMMLHDEIEISGKGNPQRKAIREYLANADVESKARFYDILKSA